MTQQPALFDLSPAGPEGFGYRPNLVSLSEEAALADDLASLTYKPFEFHVHTGRRQVAYFGWRYDYAREAIAPAADMPAFLAKLRDRAASALSPRPSTDFGQALVNLYEPGAGIGWHRDKRQFGEVIGVSLMADCLLRFRRRDGERWSRINAPIARRSVYRLSGPARSDWEHSIATHEALRYSVTFRTLA